MAKKNIFKEAVETTQEIANCYKNGLQALGKYSNKVEVADTKKCDGSVDLDTCVEKKYSRDNRWDYIFAYDGLTYFIEVHSADTGEVSTVLRKLAWLKDWLHQKAPQINKIKAQSPFFWIQSNGYHIAKNSSQERLLAQNGVRPITKLKLPIIK